MHIQQMKAYKIMWKFFIEPSYILETSRIWHFDYRLYIMYLLYSQMHRMSLNLVWKYYYLV